MKLFSTNLLLTLAISSLLAASWSPRCNGQVKAEEGVAPQKTVITADQLTFETKSSPNIVTFETNVVVADAQFELRCDKLVATFDAKTHKIMRVDADGHVTITQTARVARAQKAVYTPEDGRITLEGDPRVESPEGAVVGKTITYFRNSDKVIVSGGTRMEIKQDEKKMEPAPQPQTEPQPRPQP